MGISESLNMFPVVVVAAAVAAVQFAVQTLACKAHCCCAGSKQVTRTLYTVLFTMLSSSSSNCSSSSSSAERVCMCMSYYLSASRHTASQYCPTVLSASALHTVPLCKGAQQCQFTAWRPHQCTDSNVDRTVKNFCAAVLLCFSCCWLTVALLVVQRS
jgi:hypothetical protein